MRAIKVLRKIPVLVAVPVVLSGMLSIPADAAVRTGAANWVDQDRVEGCSITLRIPVIDPYNRVYDWNCNVQFDATGAECSLVDATAGGIYGCEAKLTLGFTGTAVRTRVDTGQKVWQCTGAQTNAGFSFYDGYSGIQFSSVAQVEVTAGQADEDPEGQSTNTVSTGTYRGALVDTGSARTLNYSGEFLLDCNRAFLGEGYGFIGQLILEQAP